MKTNLICTFVGKNQIDATVAAVRSTFNITNDKIFLMQNVDNTHEYILSYSVILLTRVQFLPNSTLFHRKRETNTFYTINALNELIILLNNGVLDKTYEIDWELYRNTMLMKKSDNIVRMKIEPIKTFII